MKLSRALLLGVTAASIMGTIACRPDQVNLANVVDKTYTKIDQYGAPLAD